MKLMIVEDEMQIRTGLVRGVSWEKYGVDEVYEAENGIEALELCYKYQPELIVTDIRMPGMDGLEFSKKAVSLYSPIKILIMTGFSEFEYVREAIKIGVVDYLLKPINIKELIEVIIRAREEIEATINAKESIQKFEEIKKQDELHDIIELRNELSQEDSIRLSKMLMLKEQDTFVMGICSIDVLENKNVGQVRIYIEKEITNILKNERVQILYWHKHNIRFMIRVLSQQDWERKKGIIKDNILVLNKLLESQFDNTVSVAISDVGTTQEIVTLKNMVKKMLLSRLYLGKKTVILENNICEDNKMNLNLINSSYIVERITHFDYDSIKNYLHEIFENYKQSKIITVDIVRGTCVELKQLLIVTVLSKGVDVEGIFEYNHDLLNVIPEYYTIDEYEEWINNIYYLIISGLHGLDGKVHNRLIVQAVDFITKNYTENISLEMVADYVCKSKNYFSYLFKKELGVSYIEYLNQVRIENAKRLLTSSDALTYEVAEQVGFSDYKYFSSVFKKVTGVSPSQYRKLELS